MWGKISLCWWLWRPARQRASRSDKMRIHCGSLMCDKRGFSIVNLLVCRVLVLRHDPSWRRVYPALCVSLIAFPKNVSSLMAFLLFFHMRVELCVNTHIRANIIALDAARRLSQLVYYTLSGWRAISDPSEKSLNSREPVDVSQSSTTTQHIATMDEKSYVNVD